MEFQQQAPLIRPASTSRINWTQTTTMTVAAFIGCLLALVAGLILYRYLVAKAIKKEAGRLDQLKLTYQQQETALHKLIQQREQPVTPPSIKSAGLAAKQESSQDETGGQETGSENQTQTTSPEDEAPQA